ncbi:hypothetical protein VT84_11440 [Gemmata sp. SH-PL17]|uniref:hypothetical protein n=1 Tax=Gemmata sp. SH-PL17 TaxID=1630693 RepID=UPI0004ACCABF|nr:hypothetical protein [Gemmata sp. SH-PL17]AMV25002.1 hypothetical protein VT84_11440 [Gemmata sp. SH-PL17]
MDIPPHVRARGYERDSPDDPLFGRYIRIDLTERPNLELTFDAVAHMVVYGQQASEVVPFSRVAWAVLVFGIEPHERERIAEVQNQYSAMWERYPNLWPKLRERECVFSVWFVDRATRPFLGCLCDENPWDVWASGRDVREERFFRKLLSSRQLPILMALNAVHPAELRGSWGTLGQAA